MTGALLQLAAMGTEDIFFTGNPQMSYFKSVFNRHSNFAMQNINIEFEGSRSLNYDSPTTLYAKIPSYGELLNGLSFEFDLPPIYNSVPFKWVENIGSSIINSVKIFIGSELIETIEGEYIHLYHNTHLTKDKLAIYNEMIGNVSEMYNPYRIIEDDYQKYDPSSGRKIPNTEGKRIVVPLPLWFSKYDGQEIPLISLKKIPVKIEIELKAVKQLYIIGKSETISVTNTNTGLSNNIDRIHFVKPTTISDKINNWLLKPRLSADYIYLSDEESKLLINFEHRYLIERVTPKEFIGNINESTIELELFNPTKELYIVPRRDDAIINNQHSNYTIYDDLSENKDYFLYQNNNGLNETDDNDINNITNLINLWNYRDTNDIPSINNTNYEYFTENIIKSMEIRFNGDVRLSIRDYDYYHKIQPYMHHTGTLPPGALLYSFSIHPEEFQPSGACNFTNFKSVELIIHFKSPYINESVNKKNTKYDIKLYTTSYNILKIENGECQLLFKT
jgi:hypothetical protein